eukprot:353683-Chlamydomonas_euryale.AAC.4
MHPTHLKSTPARRPARPPAIYGSGTASEGGPCAGAPSGAPPPPACTTRVEWLESWDDWSTMIRVVG